MTKNEILDAINNVIVSNDQKGITAEVLANILTEIVNATPEGAGAGVVVWTEELTEEQQSNNANIYDALQSGEVLPLYVYSPDEAVYFAVNMIGLTSNEIELYLSMPMGTDNGLIIGVLLVNLYPDGTVTLTEV